MALVNAFGAIALEATQLGVRADLDERYAGGKTGIGATLTTVGDNVIVTPPLGQSIRLVWISIIPSSDNLAANLVKVKFGAGGTPFYIAYALAHWEPFQGAVNAPLIVNCQTAEAVSVTAHYRVV